MTDSPAASRGGIPADPRQRLLRGRRVRARHRRAAGRREGRGRRRPTGPHRRRRPQGAVLPALRHPARHHHHLARRRHARRTGARAAARGPASRRPACPEGAVPGVSVVVGMLLASAVQMVIGELVPKNWAVSRPLQVARFVAGPQHAFSRLFRPGDLPAEHRRQPPRARPRRRARRRAGLRPHPRRTGLPGPALGAGRRPRAGHRGPVRPHPLARRADRAARHDAAREGQRPAVLGDRRGRGEPDPRHRALPLPRLPRAASTRSSAWCTSRTPSRSRPTSGCAPP